MIGLDNLGSPERTNSLRDNFVVETKGTLIQLHGRKARLHIFPEQDRFYNLLKKCKGNEVEEIDQILKRYQLSKNPDKKIGTFSITQIRILGSENETVLERTEKSTNFVHKEVVK
jgi:hypothetical protein